MFNDVITTWFPLSFWLGMSLAGRLAIAAVTMWMLFRLFDPDVGGARDVANNLLLRASCWGIMLFCVLSIVDDVERLLVFPNLVVQGADRAMIFWVGALMIWVFATHQKYVEKGR